MKNNLLLLFLSTLLGLVFCEGLIRLVLPQISEHNKLFQFDEELGWEFIPNREATIIYEGGINHAIQINQEGFRDCPFQEKKNSTKIMVVGDSFVSNISVGQNDIFTQVLEDKLNDTSVYNLGVNGYGQVQEYLILKKWVPIIEPDYIVVMLYLGNDFADNMNLKPWLYPRPSVVFDNVIPIEIIPPSDDYILKKELPFYYRSHLFHLVKNSFNRIMSKVKKNTHNLYTPPEVNTCQSPLSDKTKKMYTVIEHLLEEMKSFSSDINTPIVFALAPSIVQVEDGLWSQFEERYPLQVFERDMPNKMLLAFGKANQLQMLDLLPSLKESQSKGTRMYHPTEKHWTVEGNRVVADVLSKYIKEQMNFIQD